MIGELKKVYPKGISKACRILKTSRSSLSYVSIKTDIGLENELLKLSQDHPREGFWKSYYRIRNSGQKVNHKRLHRVYKELGLSMRRKSKKGFQQGLKRLL